MDLQVIVYTLEWGWDKWPDDILIYLATDLDAPRKVETFIREAERSRELRCVKSTRVPGVVTVS